MVRLDQGLVRFDRDTTHGSGSILVTIKNEGEIY